MIRGLWSAASGMNAQQTNLDVIANNIANANTTGYKKSRANFQDLMYYTERVAGATTPNGGQTPTGIQIGLGARTTSVQKVFTEGDYLTTDNDLDMVIEGDGFFKVLSGDEELYTRAGDFTMDSEGYITTAAGDRLQPAISLPLDTTVITLQADGTLAAYGLGDEVLTTSQINLYSFANPGGLYAMGRNLLRPTEGSGEAIEGTPGSSGFGTIANGFLEKSNVSIVEEMVGLISAQRAYEANSKAIKTADSMLSTATGLKR